MGKLCKDGALVVKVKNKVIGWRTLEVHWIGTACGNDFAIFRWFNLFVVEKSIMLKRSDIKLFYSSIKLK